MTKLYDPTAPARRETATLAPRIADLRGKTIGLLDISKAKGNIFLDHIEARLNAELQPGSIMRRTKPTFARPAPEDLRADLIEHCDCVIEALAD